MKYLITGASGQLGGYVLTYLSKLVPTEDIVALVRDDKKPVSVAGVEKRIGNYDDYDSLVKAFQGIDRVLFISSGLEDRQTQHKHMVKALIEANVKFVAYTSIANATDSKMPLAEDHRFTEALIKDSGIAHSFLRNNWYLENELNDIKGALSGAPYVISSGEGKTGWALKREYGEAAANVLAGKVPDREIFELSGKPATARELAETLKAVSGKTFDIISMTGEVHRSYLENAGLDSFFIDYLVGLQEYIKRGDLHIEKSDFETALTHPLVSLKDAVSELIK